VSGLKQSKTAKFGAVFRIVPSGTTTTTTATTNNDDKLDIVQQQQQQQQQTQEEKSKIISSITNTNNTAANTDLLLSNQKESPPKKTNTNVLLDIAPKLSNTTKKIDVKAWDNLMNELRYLKRIPFVELLCLIIIQVYNKYSLYYSKVHV